ncbi:MAG TPA: DUF6152 family protein [Gammaproteobacteria bacterium]|nr:DUF6152 family protein [Gammaproteobacteria bacterium]
MSRGTVRSLALILGLGIAGMAAAHHPPLMERCESFTFTGEIERIDWSNPHVELYIRADDGMTYRTTWLNMHQLGQAGIDRNTLRVGDALIITVGTRDDVVEKPMLLSAITRTGDGWAWSQVPQGC